MNRLFELKPQLATKSAAVQSGPTCNHNNGLKRHRVQYWNPLCAMTPKSIMSEKLYCIVKYGAESVVLLLFLNIKPSFQSLTTQGTVWVSGDAGFFVAFCISSSSSSPLSSFPGPGYGGCVLVAVFCVHKAIISPKLCVEWPRPPLCTPCASRSAAA